MPRLPILLYANFILKIQLVEKIKDIRLDVLYHLVREAGLEPARPQ